jgi:hypothetical protein
MLYSELHLSACWEFTPASQCCSTIDSGDMGRRHIHGIDSGDVGCRHIHGSWQWRRSGFSYTFCVLIQSYMHAATIPQLDLSSIHKSSSLSITGYCPHSSADQSTIASPKQAISGDRQHTLLMLGVRMHNIDWEQTHEVLFSHTGQSSYNTLPS